jgi:23S rRNA maturation-related 3'-5' exoribonuclease YhaM
MVICEISRLAREDESQPSDFLRRPSRDRADLVCELRELIDSLRSPVRDVVVTLEPEVECSPRRPRTEDIDHAWPGGLLEHGNDVTRLREAIIRVISGPDHDLAVAGAPLHDLEKRYLPGRSWLQRS